jgi:hypothetical protein
MSRPPNRLHKTLPAVVPTLFAACCLGLPLLQAGCGDVDVADKQVHEQLAEGEQKVEAAITAAPAIPEGYKKAATINNASPAVRVEALVRLADAERDRAVALLGEADRMDVELYRLVGAVNRQSSRIQSNNTLIAGLGKLQPTKAQQAIQQQRAAAQGEQKPVWIEHETGPIEALKGLKEHAAQLQEQIGQLEKQSKDLATQRSKMIADAEQLERQSEEAKGQQSSELYNQSVDSRRQAADLSAQVEALEAKLTPLREDLARAQANEQAITKTVQTFGTQLQATQQSWEKVQAQIAELQNLNKRILGGSGADDAAPLPPTTRPAAAAAAAQPEADTATAGAAARPAGGGAPPQAPSIAGKLTQLNALVAEIEGRRTEAETLLKSALDHTKQAGDVAAGLVRELSSRISSGNNAQRPERKAWEQMVALNNPSRFKLKQATLDIVLAGLYRSRAADLALRGNMAQVLADALKPAELPLPQSAGGPNQATEADTTRKASLDAYAEAEQLLKDVIEAPKSNDMTGDAAKAGHLMQLVRIYSQAQADPQNGASLLASAKAVAAQGEQVQLPTAALPAFVLDALELRPQPTTGPATRPGTAAPGTAAPGTAAPGTAAPGTATPGTAAPDASTPTPPAGTGTPETPPPGGATPATPPAGASAAPAPDAK